MQLSPLLGAGAAIAAAGLFFAARDVGTAATPPLPPAANGHYVLVVEGDRDQLAVTAANHKQDPWAGVPKGFTSDWTLTIRDARGQALAVVPLDVTPFDLDPARKGQGRIVQGCIVRDPRIAMLVNAPCHATAASYTFARGKTVLGTVAADAVQKLAGGGR